MKKQKKVLKNMFRIVGVALLLFEFLMLAILFFDNSPVMWESILPTLIIIPAIGAILLYFTRNRSATIQNKDSGELSNQKKFKYEMKKEISYRPNDIICMAVVYEGHLPIDHVLDNHSLANEIIDVVHTQGLSTDIKLCSETVIKIQRANEAAFWAGDYEPKSDLKPLITECYKEVKEILNFDIPTKLNVKDMVFKTRSSLVSTVWVQINVMQ